MMLTEKVKVILIEMGEVEKANSMQTVNLLSDMFYAHYQENLNNHVSLKQFIIDNIQEV